MSVEEVIEQIKRMTPEEQVRVREAVDGLVSPEQLAGEQRLRAVYAMLDEGWCQGDGSPVADTIDELLYGTPL